MGGRLAPGNVMVFATREGSERNGHTSREGKEENHHSRQKSVLPKGRGVSLLSPEPDHLQRSLATERVPEGAMPITALKRVCLSAHLERYTLSQRGPCRSRH